MFLPFIGLYLVVYSFALNWSALLGPQPSLWQLHFQQMVTIEGHLKYSRAGRKHKPTKDPLFCYITITFFPECLGGFKAAGVWMALCSLLYRLQVIIILITILWTCFISEVSTCCLFKFSSPQTRYIFQ